MPEEVPQKWAGLHGMMVDFTNWGKYAHMRVLDARYSSPLVVGDRTPDRLKRTNSTVWKAIIDRIGWGR